MSTNDSKSTTDRRRFLGSLATGAAAVSLATFTPSLNVHAEETAVPIGADDPDAWFNKLKGKHRMVFDVPMPGENIIMPFAWSRVFMLTNGGKDCGAVVVLRHEGIPYAFEDRIWEKYKFGEMFKVNDPKTSKPSIRNPFWKPQKGDFKVPGLGEVQIGINELQPDGVMFCVCNMAMMVYTAVTADAMKMKPEDVMNDWKAGLLPGVQIVPSGVWAVGRAQEHGCRYCYAG
ncbi:MAG: hypothetical protein ACHQEB_03585 [Chitinophagales bacterium]